MPEEVTEQAEDVETTPRGGTRRFAVIAVALLGLAGGGLLGMTALGPAVGPMLAARAGGGHGAEESASSIYVIDNLIVNPARSGGTRFLLTTIAVETVTPEFAEIVAAHDVELRDRLIVVLGAKTTDELADIGARQELIAELKKEIESILGPGIVLRVYMPQFVIQ